MKNIRVLIVDDSAFMRKSLSMLLESDDNIEIVGTARDGLDGYEKVKELKPDIVTLDIEMPRMDGLTALEKIMKDCPTPVLMVSSLTTEGADSTLKALELGAIDFIPKEMSFVSVNIVNIKDQLIKKVKTIVRTKALHQRISRIHGTVSTTKETTQISSKLKALPKIGYKAVTIGISTGGPLSLQKLIPKLKPNLNVPVFIVQHMPPKFTKSLADRLNNMSQIKVKEAENNEEIKNDTVYLAPGGFHLKVGKGVSGTPIIKITEEPSNTLHRPAVDIMMNSVIDMYGKKTMGIIMTGMGKDGTEGAKKLKQLGGYLLAQDEASCVVYGMPKSIVDSGLADVISPLEKIGDIVNEAL